MDESIIKIFKTDSAGDYIAHMNGNDILFAKELIRELKDKKSKIKKVLKSLYNSLPPSEVKILKKRYKKLRSTMRLLSKKLLPTEDLYGF